MDEKHSLVPVSKWLSAVWVNTRYLLAEVQLLGYSLWLFEHL